ncbi:MAG TPA: polyphosphate kinase 2 family protein [Thermoanaerobaculia bacterium]|jgi:PPK2 family polyphosphate:nucleotide phosphotransferase
MADRETKRYRIKPDTRIRIDDFDPDETKFVRDKDEAVDKSAKFQERLAELQELLYAEHKHKVLIVLQGMDTSGKDGTVRHVMGGFNPAGVRVVSFKKPTPPELDHDYLWRVHAQVPATGEVVVFNRSHYEDVLVVRVHDLVPEDVWSRRYDQIKDFERMLAESGTTILKFFLHISKDEQRERLEARIRDPKKRWKFQHGDIEERKLWKDYVRAYDDVLEKTSTKWAPWYVVPANTKWYRNYIVGAVLTRALEDLDMRYPEPDLSDQVVE